MYHVLNRLDGFQFDPPCYGNIRVRAGLRSNVSANARGKAFVNLLPIEPGDSIMNVLPLPEDEATWDSYDIMFATKSGDVRRNKLSDFASVNRAGKIAMDLEEGDSMVGVALCTAEDDVMLTTALGRAMQSVLNVTV